MSGEIPDALTGAWIKACNCLPNHLSLLKAPPVTDGALSQIIKKEAV